MAISRITAQDATGSSATTSVTATYPGATTTGRLLIACVGHKNSTSAATITGWTQATTTFAPATSVTLTILYRIADGTEAAITANRASATAMTLAIFEYQGNEAAPLDAIVTAGDGGTPTSLAIGPTATLSQADELAIAAIALGNTFSAPSWTNGFTNHATISVANSGLMVADLVVAATTALSTTGSWTTGRSAAGAIVTFKASAVVATRTDRFFGAF